jgi:hypothetical protein
MKGGIPVEGNGSGQSFIEPLFRVPHKGFPSSLDSLRVGESCETDLKTGGFVSDAYSKVNLVYTISV